MFNLASLFTKKQNKDTIIALKKFRKENWDKSLSRNEAYKRYIND